MESENRRHGLNYYRGFTVYNINYENLYSAPSRNYSMYPSNSTARY